MSLDTDAGPRPARHGLISGVALATSASPLPALAPWLVLAGLFALAIALRLEVAGNTDVGWLLIVGERVLDGQRLYADILETNPPIAVLVYLPGVLIARALGLRPETVTDGLVLTLAAASLVATVLMLRNSAALNGARRWPLLALAVAVETILPTHVFGQREHIALMAFAPGLAALVLRGNRESIPPWAVGVAAFGAAVMLMFKPYFALALGGGIITAAIRARSWRVLFAPENIAAAVIVAAYGVFIWLRYPEYFTLIYPLVRDVYLPLVVSWPELLMGSATMLWLTGVAFAVLLRRRESRAAGRHEKSLSALWVVLAGSLGFAAAFYLQRKGWAYQSYPMIALAIMALGLAILSGDTATPADRRLRVGGTIVLGVIFAASCLWFNASFNVRDIDAPVARIKAHPKILMLSSEAVIGHPLVRNLNGTWVSRQQGLWVREFVRRLRQNGSVDLETDARLDFYVTRERAALIEDFKKQPPDIVLVDNLSSDWGAWAQADAEISALLKPYALAQTVHGIDILRRLD
jgi:hypothetical protein